MIHPLADVEEGAIIHETAKIWRWTHVREGTRIGAHCHIGQGCYIDVGVVLGDHVKVQNGVYLYQGVLIADDVFIGPNVTFTNDLFPRSKSTDWEPMATLILKGASIGAGSVILCGITLGAYCMIGAGSVVTKTIEPYTVVAGNPAYKIGCCTTNGKMGVNP